MQKPKEHNNVAFFWKECLHNHAGMPLLIGLMLKQSKLQLTFLLYLQTTCCWQTLRNMVCPSAGLEHPHNPYLPSDLAHKQLVADKPWEIWCARVLGWSIHTTLTYLVTLPTNNLLLTNPEEYGVPECWAGAAT